MKESKREDDESLDFLDEITGADIDAFESSAAGTVNELEPESEPKSVASRPARAVARAHADEGEPLSLRDFQHAWPTALAELYREYSEVTKLVASTRSIIDAGVQKLQASAAGLDQLTAERAEALHARLQGEFAKAAVAAGGDLISRVDQTRIEIERLGGAVVSAEARVAEASEQLAASLLSMTAAIERIDAVAETIEKSAAAAARDRADAERRLQAAQAQLAQAQKLRAKRGLLSWLVSR